MIVQPDLWTAAADPPWLQWPTTKLERRFAEFHKRNPHIYVELERRALALVGKGAHRIGVKALWEVLRYDAAVRSDDRPWRLNNSYTALYARLLIARRPELAEVIETRERRSA